MTEIRYTTQQAAAKFGINRQTVINWAEAFAEYMSPSANPGGSRTRYFTADDMQVLDFANQCKADGLTYDEIRAGLARGQRGQPPVESPEEMAMILASDVERQLTFQIDLLNRKVDELQTENETLREIEKKYHESLTEIRMLREQLAKTEDTPGRINELYKLIGKLEAKIEMYEKKE